MCGPVHASCPPPGEHKLRKDKEICVLSTVPSPWAYVGADKCVLPVCSMNRGARELAHLLAEASWVMGTWKVFKHLVNGYADVRVFSWLPVESKPFCGLVEETEA